MHEIDNKDKKILLELDLDARQSYAKIGKKLNLSKEVVSYRINKLLEQKIITNFTSIIDYSQLGIITLRTFLKLCNLENEKLTEIIDYLKNTQQIGWGVTIIGRWDINFIFWGKTIGEFSEFWKKFYIKFGKYIEEKKNKHC